MGMIRFIQRSINIPCFGVRTGSVELIRTGFRRQSRAVAVIAQFIVDGDGFIILTRSLIRDRRIIHRCVIGSVRLVCRIQGRIDIVGGCVIPAIVQCIRIHLRKNRSAVTVAVQRRINRPRAVIIRCSCQRPGLAIVCFADLGAAVAVMPQLRKRGNGFIIFAAVHQGDRIVIHMDEIFRVILICFRQTCVNIADGVIISRIEGAVGFDLLQTVIAIPIATHGDKGVAGFIVAAASHQRHRGLVFALRYKIERYRADNGNRQNQHNAGHRRNPLIFLFLYRLFTRGLGLALLVFDLFRFFPLFARNSFGLGALFGFDALLFLFDPVFIQMRLQQRGVRCRRKILPRNMAFQAGIALLLPAAAAALPEIMRGLHIVQRRLRAPLLRQIARQLIAQFVRQGLILRLGQRFKNAVIFGIPYAVVREGYGLQRDFESNDSVIVNDDRRFSAEFRALSGVQAVILVLYGIDLIVKGVVCNQIHHDRLYAAAIDILPFELCDAIAGGCIAVKRIRLQQERTALRVGNRILLHAQFKPCICHVHYPPD